MTTSQSAQPRFDLYAFIHKALRLLMTDTLARVGQTDPASDAHVQATLAQVDTLLALCEKHLNAENTFVHPAMERALPGSCARVADEHRDHEESLADLRDLVGLVRDRDGAARVAAMTRLYHAVALFVAHNLEHMHFEETEHNRVLQAHYSDAELEAIEHDIVASMPPEAKAMVMRWFILALNPDERVQFLSGMRQAMPAPAFAGILASTRALLTLAEHARLLRAFGLAPSDAMAA